MIGPKPSLRRQTVTPPSSGARRNQNLCLNIPLRTRKYERQSYGRRIDCGQLRLRTEAEATRAAGHHRRIANNEKERIMAVLEAPLTTIQSEALRKPRANVELRTYVYLDRLQPQFAAYLGANMRGYLPVVNMAA